MKKRYPASSGTPAGRWRTVLAVAAAAALGLPAAALAHQPRVAGTAATGSAGTIVMAPDASVGSADPIASLVTASRVFEQHTRGGGSSGGGQAVPRGGSSAPPATSGGGSRGGSGDGGAVRSGGDSGSTATPRGGARTRGSAGADNGDGTTATTGSRPRGDRPATGTAVQRRPGDRPPIIIDPGGYYGGGFYPWGWGGLGLGGYYYGYYDPWGWYDPYPSGVYASGDYDGALKIKVKPRDAEVYVDGYFAGEVDDYDGVFQKLRLEPGPHRIELRLEGYEPLTFEVRILPDRTVTYKGELKKGEGAN
jgi:hypothetical protein